MSSSALGDFLEQDDSGDLTGTVDLGSWILLRCTAKLPLSGMFPSKLHRAGSLQELLWRVGGEVDEFQCVG